MNKELIRKMYSEATVWCEENAIGTPVAWEFEEKFAELIVRECAHVAYETTFPNGGVKAMTAIYERFGIE
jgi:hypothetical protein